MKLAEYQYTIHYKPGVNNTNADALSRIHKVITRSLVLLKEANPLELTETQEASLLLKTTETQDCLKPQEGTEDLSEYQQFLQADKNKLGPTSNVIEISGDLFDIDSETHLSIVGRSGSPQSRSLPSATPRPDTLSFRRQLHFKRN